MVYYGGITNLIIRGRMKHTEVIINKYKQSAYYELGSLPHTANTFTDTVVYAYAK